MRIRIYTSDDKLFVRVSDNGVGISYEKLGEINERLSKGLDYVPKVSGTKNNHIALININQRIKHLFGDSYGVSVMSVKGEGTFVELTVPIQREIMTVGADKHVENSTAS